MFTSLLIPKPQRRPAARRGAVSVEFALVLPIVFAFALGMVEYMNAEYIRQGVAEAAYEGARQGIVRGATTGEVQSATERKLRMLGLNRFTVRATMTDTTVTIQVSVPFSGNSFGISNILAIGQIEAGFTLEREIS